MREEKKKEGKVDWFLTELLNLLSRLNIIMDKKEKIFSTFQMIKRSSKTAI